MSDLKAGDVVYKVIDARLNNYIPWVVIRYSRLWGKYKLATEAMDPSNRERWRCVQWRTPQELVKAVTINGEDE